MEDYQNYKEPLPPIFITSYDSDDEYDSDDDIKTTYRRPVTSVLWQKPTTEIRIALLRYKHEEKIYFVPRIVTQVELHKIFQGGK